MRARVCASIIASTVTLIVACSDDSSSVATPAPDAGIDSGTPPPEADGSTSETSTSPLAPCDAIASRECEQRFKCVPSDLEGRDAELARCKARLALVCNEVEALPGVTKAGPDCAIAPGPFACESTPRIDEPLPDACRPYGAYEAGASCQNDRQCASGRCRRAGLGECGVCVASVGATEACSVDAPCKRGLRCVNGTCGPRKAQDAACNVDDNDCVIGTYCMEGTCKPLLTEGQPCTPTTFCDFHLFCSAAGTCARVPFTPPTGQCNSSATAPVICMNDAPCAVEPGSDVGKCSPNVGDGETCGGFAGPFCEAGSVCGDDMKCALERDLACK